MDVNATQWLWLDDERRPPNKAWVWCKTYEEAVALLQTGAVCYASLDHDLGADVLGPLKSGYHLTLWMAEHGVWPEEGVMVHSANGVGARNMCATVDHYGPYSRPCRWEPAPLT